MSRRLALEVGLVLSIMLAADAKPQPQPMAGDWIARSGCWSADLAPLDRGKDGPFSQFACKRWLDKA